jgi:hypothetical protein
MKDFRGQDFTKPFEKIKVRAQIVIIIAFLDFIFLTVWISNHQRGTTEDSHLPLAVKFGVILWLGIMACAAIDWRCPACRSGLGRGWPNFCETCGAMLEWPEGTEPFPADIEPKCGQCGITLRKGNDGCHWCGWKPKGVSADPVRPFGEVES